MATIYDMKEIHTSIDKISKQFDVFNERRMLRLQRLPKMTACDDETKIPRLIQIKKKV